jgi:hypothetical protein
VRIATTTVEEYLLSSAIGRGMASAVSTMHEDE